MIVDEHDMVRRALTMFLRVCEDLELVGEARNGQEALWMCERLRPDVVLMDLRMPVMDGLTATRRVRERWPEVRVIALTSFHEEDLVHDALNAGAIGYLLKNVSGHRLAEAIRAAKIGQSTLAPEASQALEQSAGAGHSLNEGSSLNDDTSLGKLEEPALAVEGKGDP
jgi:NarL family two-component system response regulator LiaR